MPQLSAPRRRRPADGGERRRVEGAGWRSGCSRKWRDFARVAELFQSIWTKQGETSPVNVETLRALSKAGSYVAGAFEHDELVGACFGFFAAPDQRALHSHIAGVSARMRGRSASASRSRCISAPGRSRRASTRSPGRSIR